MSKKKNKKVSEGDENNEVEESNKEENDANNEKKGGENGGKKDGGGGGGGGKNAVVLKIDLHCEGCASKVVKRIRAFEGVVNVEVDGATNKLSVTGKVDPVKLRQELEEKLHKKVELISPVPKKGKDDGKSKDASCGGEGDDGKAEKKKDGNESNKSKKSDEKKEKEVTITTAVLKVPLHCEGCIQKINKIITKAKGYQEMKIDRQKDLVTVTGAIDMKALAESLKKHLKKDVEVVPPKKEEKKDKEKENEKEKGKGGGSGGGGAGGKGKGGGAVGSGGGGGKGKGGVEGEDGGADEGKTDQANKMQVQFGYGYPMMPYMPGAPYGPPRLAPPGAPYGPPGYDPYQFSVHAPQIFSDENPNACSIM